MIPRRFSRYLVFELTKVFVVALGVMTLLMVMVGVVQESIREGLTPLTILQLIPYTLPNALCFAIPGTILFSVCIVLGRMSSENEITAVKAAGLSPMVVIWPILFLAFMLSLATVVLNDVAVSWGRHGVYRVILHSVQRTVYAKLNAEKAYRRNNIAISVDRVDGIDLYGLVIEVHADDSQKPFYLTAQRARLEVDPDRDMLVISTEHGLIEGSSTMLSIDRDKFELPLSSMTRKKDRSISPSNLPIRLISSEIRKQRSETHQRRRRLAIDAAMQMLGGDLLALSDAGWQFELQELAESEYREHRLRTEPWRRWANGFSCLAFVMVGIPLALRLRRADFWTIFATSFIPILIVYYPLLMIGVGYAKVGQLPPPSVWLANMVLFLAGGWMIRQAVRR